MTIRWIKFCQSEVSECGMQHRKIIQLKKKKFIVFHPGHRNHRSKIIKRVLGVGEEERVTQDH